jgi:hypothetical protein
MNFWQDGFWSPTFWSADMWQNDGAATDIPVALTASIIAALTATGQPSTSTNLTAAPAAVTSMAPRLTAGQGFGANVPSSISIEADLVAGAPVLSELAAAINVVLTAQSDISVSGSAYSVLSPSVALQQGVKLAGQSSSNLTTFGGIGFTVPLSAVASSTATSGMDAYIAWPVATDMSLSSMAAAELWLKNEVAAMASGQATTTLSWKLDQGLAGASHSAAQTTPSLGQGRAFAASGSASLNASGGVGLAYAFSGASTLTGSLTPWLGTAEQVQGGVVGALNLYSLLNQSQQVRGSVSALLSGHWSTTPFAGYPDNVVVGDPSWSVTADPAFQATAPQHLLYAYSLAKPYVASSKRTLAVTADARAWAFNSKNSQYIFEGVDHESYGAQGPGGSEGRDLRLQSRNRKF